MNRDSMEEEGGLNLFGFGPNSPIDGVDVQGRWWFLVPLVVKGAHLAYKIYKVHKAAKKAKKAKEALDKARKLKEALEKAEKAEKARKAAEKAKKAKEAAEKAKKLKEAAEKANKTKKAKKTQQACKKKKKSKWIDCEKHHIATKYAPWSPHFEAEFAKAGMTLGKYAGPTHPNVCLVCDIGDGRKHKGPHPPEYQAQIQAMVDHITNDETLDKERKKEILTSKLNEICRLLNRRGGRLRRLITAPNRKKK